MLEPAKTEVIIDISCGLFRLSKIVQRFSRSSSQKPYSEPKPATGNKVAKPFFPTLCCIILWVFFLPWYLKLRPQLWLIQKAQGFPAAALTKVMSLKAEAICMGRGWWPVGSSFFHMGRVKTFQEDEIIIFSLVFNSCPIWLNLPMLRIFDGIQFYYLLSTAKGQAWFGLMPFLAGNSYVEIKWNTMSLGGLSFYERLANTEPFLLKKKLSYVFHKYSGNWSSASLR